MFELNESVIKNLAGIKNYENAQDLYIQNQIKTINASQVDNNEYGIKIIDIDAVVDENYGVEIGFNDKSGIMHYKCDCASYLNDSNRFLCAHLAATLLKFLYNKEDILIKSRYSSTFNLLEIVEKNIVNLNRSELNIQIRIIIKNTIKKITYLEIKVGVNKYYVVKNIESFLGAIINKDNIEIAKDFTIDFSKYNFNYISDKLTKILLEIYELELFYINNESIKKEKYINGKKIYLTDYHVKRILTLFNDKEIELIINDSSVSKVRISNLAVPINIKVYTEKNDIIVEQENNLALKITEDGEFLYYENEIYKLEECKRDSYIPIYDTFIISKSKMIYFNKEENQRFIRYMIPQLKSIASNFTLDTSFQNQLVEENLKVSIFLDKFNNEITASIKFIYGDAIIDSFNNDIRNSDGKFIVRNFIAEGKILKLIGNMGFYIMNGIYKLSSEEEVLLDFISQDINILKKEAEIYYSEEFKKIKINTNIGYKTNIRLSNNNFLEVSFNMDGIEKIDLKGLFKELKRKRKYYKLKNGEYLNLRTNDLQEASDFIDEFDIKESDFTSGKALMNNVNLLRIDDYIKGRALNNLDVDLEISKVSKSIREKLSFDFFVPNHLDSIMREYQKYGFTWFKILAHYNLGGILADEMGLGKTLQTIAFIESEIISNDENKPCLIIVPSSLMFNWEAEINKFSNELKTLIVVGNKETRDDKIKNISNYHIVITSYPLIRRDIEGYDNINFSYCFLDEAQEIKNPSSINAQFAKKIIAKCKFALTGTPIQNSLSELWSIFDFIMPGYLYNYNKFAKKYEIPIIKNQNNKILGELNDKISPFILRRLKKDVISELPPKIEHIVTVEMTDEQKAIYLTYLNEAKVVVKEEMQNRNISKIKILSLLTRLRQICCDPSIIMENYVGESGKLLALEELVEESIESGHRILLFSQFTSALKNIMKRLSEKNIKLMYLDGSTKAEERINMVNEFNDGDHSIFLISLKAGGTGLNLTGADTVIHFDPWWNPAAEDQASDRAHRIGQNKTVEVIKLVTRGTIEEKIYDLQVKKKKIINSVLKEESSDNGHSSMLNNDDIRHIFNLE